MPACYDAVVLAGRDTTGPGVLAAAEGVAQKALISVGGVPIVAHVLRAARACPRVRRIAVVGLDADLNSFLSPDAQRDLCALPDAGGLVDNLFAGLRCFDADGRAASHVLVLAGDTPLLTPEALTWFVDACHPADREIYYAMVRRETVLAAFPTSQRSYLRTRDGRFCGADMALVHPSALVRQEERLRALVGRRKSVAAELRLLGWGWVLRLLLGRIRLPELYAAVERLSGIRGMAVELPFAGAAMDVDKPSDLTVVRAAWAQKATA
jgi:molybdopterin-guanine dinucleotide biosynthesis protein A